MRMCSSLRPPNNFIGASKLIQTIKNTIVKVPQLGIIGGIALVALGSVITAAANKKQGFATGTRNSPAGQFLVGERGPELVSLPKGSQVNTNGQLNAMKGGNSYIMETVIRGQDLAVILKRTDQRNSRNG